MTAPDDDYGPPDRLREAAPALLPLPRHRPRARPRPDGGAVMSDMVLMHYAATPVTLDRTRPHHGRNRDDKPSGLWVSVLGEDDWPSWCQAEEFGLDALAYEHRVTLAPSARILHLDTYEAVLDLPGRYPAQTRYWTRDRFPDWTAIAADFDGIIIAPYQWRARSSFDTFWYYTWDCASGCIWNLHAIESFNLVRTPEAARR